MMDNHPLEIGPVLKIYSEFTAADLEVGDGVRQIPVYIHLQRSYPAMSRAEAMKILDDALLKAGVAVYHRDTNHVVFTLRRAISR